MSGKKKLYVVSNAHLDTQWNWTVQDTIRDSLRDTLDKNFELFEKYPHYRFNFEGAFRYRLMQEYYPEKFEKLREYVKQGRWNVAGSQWDASDANVPSSEAYMRQILLGNGYFEKEFGKKSSDIFLTDCFGFRWSLPSIAAHMGLNGFSTQKLVWGVGSPIYNEDGTARKPMPEKDVPRMDLGKWVGPDGHYVIASMLGGNYTYHFEWDESKRPIHNRSEYEQQIDFNEKWTGVPSRMMYYGVGDFGGSPSEESVRYLNEAVEQNGENQAFEVVSSSTDQIMNELTPEQIEKLPEYKEGLLIPHGYGALTSHTINKRWNRKSELLADSAERAADIAEFLGTAEYPKKRLENAWKLFLWHQFHDDLPGTSILNAYQFSHNDFVVAQNIFAAELTASVDSAATALKTDVVGTPVLVYNPVSHARRDVVRVRMDVKTPYVRVLAPCGKEMPAQVEIVDGKTYVVFVARMKPVCMTVFDVQESQTPSVENTLSVSQYALSNERYTVTLNEQGDIASIWDKENGKELLSAPSGLEIRPDNNTVWPSWEIKYADVAVEPTRITECSSIEIVENGPAAVAIQVVKTYKGSTFKQIIRLTAGSHTVEIENHVDWFCRRSMLQAEFPLTVSNEIAEFDLGLGADKGKNTNSFPYFQHCVHQWADLTDSDSSYGVAILNDCKYGMEKPTDHTLRLSLIHTPLGSFMPVSAEDWQDMGTNIFRYGITGHKGERTGVAAEAEAFNQPLMAFIPQKHDGLQTPFSLLSIDQPDVLIRAVKKEEKGNRLIVRVQETSGKACEKVTLKFADTILSAVETNGYEDEIGAASYKDNELSFSIGGFEPKTFALTLKSSSICHKSGVTIDLPYTDKVTTTLNDLTSGQISNGISIPEELFESDVDCGGVSFRMGDPSGKNAVSCAGQTIKLPGNTQKVALLAVSRSGDKKVCFKIGDQSVTLAIQDFGSPVGAWDMLARGDSCMIKRDDVATVYTHTHDENGVRIYKFAYLFKYVLDTNGADTLTLPNDQDILVFAATTVTGANTVPAAPLYDVADLADKKVHTVTVLHEDGSREEKKVTKGTKCVLSAGELGGQGMFDHWETDGKIVSTDETYLVLEAEDKDVSAKPVYKSIGENVVLHKPCTASGQTGENEGPAMAVNGADDNKWCAQIGKDHLCWLEVDIGDPTFIDRWVVRHCGKYESSDWNTFDFALQYRTYENEDWKCADAVVANTEDLTYREFKPVMARFVRLLITLPCRPGTDDFARIYQFQVYKAKQQ